MGSQNCMDRKHYVLVHGACHGAWCWYKLKPRLESAGHKVTVLDLAASGTNMKKIEDVDTFSEYSAPLLQLMATIPSNEKLVLVGHSLGGLNIALAMEKFPEKVAVGVFLTAFAPDTEHHPSYVLEKLEMTSFQFQAMLILQTLSFLTQFRSISSLRLLTSSSFLTVSFLPLAHSLFLGLSQPHLLHHYWPTANLSFLPLALPLVVPNIGFLSPYNERTPLAAWLDTEFAPSGNKTSMFFGPNFLSDKLYQLSPIEDLELAKTLARPSSLFMEDLTKQKNFSKEGYGSVPRAFIVCTEDLGIPLEYQLLMIQNVGFNDVVEVKDADHMVMLCKPQELFDSLQQIATKYA
ncbi:Methylesterase 1 [Glycine max]|nr:Methylesterase 1 [Glycine max]